MSIFCAVVCGQTFIRAVHDTDAIDGHVKRRFIEDVSHLHTNTHDSIETEHTAVKTA